MKGFEKTFINNYSELDSSTKYRFAELELSYAHTTLLNLFQFEPNAKYKTEDLLFNILVPLVQRPELEEDFDKFLYSQPFRKPRKDELVNYMRYKGVSYQKIRDLTKVSFNTISGMRFSKPIHFNVFPHWDDEMLQRWNRAKISLNIFNEEIIPNKPWTESEE